MKNRIHIKRSDLPIIAAGIVIVIGVLFWGHTEQKRTNAMTNTRITLASLQVALGQYQQFGGRIPKLLKGHPSIYSFLIAYQQFYARRNAAGQWQNSPHLLIYLRPELTAMGWIPMPQGGKMRGIVLVRDGFGHLIHFLNNPVKNRHAPCFAVKLPMEAGKSKWIYSSDEITGY
ncbi:MAG: hypothetical protein ACP5VQ_03365 [Phycisphaerae bacterium]